MARKARVLIGTCGWNYRAWAEGVFYPPKLATSRWLNFYSERLATVEVNNTFYQLPGSQVFRRWRERTPAGFVFSVKASRFITHMKKLAEPHRHVARFLRGVCELEPKLGVVLFQLPPLWTFDAERLGKFAEYLARQRIVSGLRVALELRNASWNCKQCFDLLRQHGIALALTDWPGLTTEGPLTGDFVFVRRHGPGQLYASNYSESALRRDSRRVQAWVRAGKDVYVYFNNDARGHAVQNAMRLRELITRARQIHSAARRGTPGTGAPQRIHRPRHILTAKFPPLT